MTLTQINAALGQDWFKGGDGITQIFYAEDSDVIDIVVAKVFHVEETGTTRNLWEYTGDGKIPTKVTRKMQEGMDMYVRCHSLDKHQARGCYEL